MSEEEKQAFGAKLLGRLDENSDGMMSFDEFGGWFRRTCASIEKYRRGLSQKKKPALALTVGDKKDGGLSGADLYKLYAKDAAAGGQAWRTDAGHKTRAIHTVLAEGGVQGPVRAGARLT